VSVNVRRRRAAVATLIGLVVALVVGVLIVGGSSSPSAVHVAPRAAAAPTAHSHWPSSETAAWVVAENRRRGTTAWQIPASVQQNQIAGFADHDDVTLGQTVTFYVTTPSPTYRVVAYRMGWYRGLGGREIWASPKLSGIVQPACPLTSGINMVSCANWTPSLTVTLTRDFVQGDYLFKLVGSGGQEGYVPLTISSPTSRATYLIVNRTMTEVGWNAWGGYSFYQGVGACAPGSDTYPVCNRARVLSLDRPFDTGYGASDFFGNEYPLIEYCEQHGLDVTYVTDITLDANPALALNHRALLSLGHDETWSYNERQGVVAAIQHGANVAFFGAAAVLRHVRMAPSPLGPERTEINYRDSSEDPLNGAGNPDDVTGNTFASPPTNLAPEQLTGELYSGYLNGAANVPFVVADAGGFAFKGTRLRDGDELPGVISSDFDHLSSAPPLYEDLQIFGHSPIPVGLAYTNQGDWLGTTYADMTYYTDPVSHGGVFDTGTVNWIHSMNSCSGQAPGCPAALVRKITGNILHLFGEGPSGVTTPSVANWQQTTPVGS
jgi:hypothetical protein